MKTRKAFATSAFLILCSLAGAGCIAALEVITEVISAVVDAIPIIEEIVEWVNRHFAAQPDPAAQAVVETKISAYRMSLVNVERTVRTHGQSSELVAAKDECTARWKDLANTLTKLNGVKATPRSDENSFRVILVDEKTGNVLNVPEPAAGEWK